MVVAVKNTPEARVRPALNPLAVGSLAGTVYVLGSLAVLFYLIPLLWRQLITPWLAGALGGPVNEVLLLLALLAAAVGLGWGGLGLYWRGFGAAAPRGLRAGIACGVVAVLVIGLVASGFGGALERSMGGSGAVAGLVLTAVIGVGLLVAAGSLFFRSGFDAWLVGLEEQGWFTARAYKRSQGQRVRRGTMLGLLILAGCGIYTMLAHGTLANTASPHWQVAIPFSGGKSLILLPDIRFTVPILIAALSLWLAYRVVNLPAFADFLIATEAELNKVSWTTRRRLIQDTIVVLVTVVLLTTFLFVVDLFWIKLLGNRYIQVIQTGPNTEQVQALDSDIDRVSRERQQAAAAGDNAKVTELDRQLDDLRQKRASAAPEKQGVPQDW